MLLALAARRWCCAAPPDAHLAPEAAQCSAFRPPTHADPSALCFFSQNMWWKDMKVRCHSPPLNFFAFPNPVSPTSPLSLDAHHHCRRRGHPPRYHYRSHSQSHEGLSADNLLSTNLPCPFDHILLYSGVVFCSPIITRFSCPSHIRSFLNSATIVFVHLRFTTINLVLTLESFRTTEP